MPLFGDCRKERSEAETSRRLKANDREFNLSFEYATNAIKTSKYNLLTFLPLNLFEQFQRIANTYFLFLLILQLIPEISSLSWFTTVVPLVLVLTVTAVKDGIDDLNRHKSDKQVNSRQVQVLIHGQLENKQWSDICVGDIIKLENNEFVTADLLLLSSSEPYGLAYIETAELDGETNLKVRQALTLTGEMGNNIQKLYEFDGEVESEPPNNKLDKFTGTLVHKEQKYSLDNDKILLRGCTLRNTDWCFGLVIFAGPDTKLMQNSGKTVFKRTSIDRLMNILVLWIFGFLAFLCLVLAICNGFWEHHKGYYFQVFLPWPESVSSATFSGFLTFWSYVIILNTLVPISLYVSVEIIRLGNSFYIDWDRKMYYPKNNTPAEARTTTLNEELGQIKYIFSDKTGTLTQNIMTFNKCSINGKTYGDVFNFAGQRIEITNQTEKVDFSYNQLADPKFVFYDHSLVEAVKLGDKSSHEFFRLLALCHTVMSEEKQDGQLVYQAQSPDENALVTAARNFGFVFHSRTPESITVVEMGETKIYELLAILDFNNFRKRMSVIVRSPENRLVLYCKGADTIIFQLLHQSCKQLMDNTTDHLDEFAGDGLRTLVLAYKDLDKQYFEEWQSRYYEASTAMEERDEKLSELYEEIEKDMQLLGATAIEDKLQDGVPQTIEKLSNAGIKIWVLTGDKQETAINIGYSCNMLHDEMKEVFVIEGNTREEVQEELRNARAKMKPETLEEEKIIIRQPMKKTRLLPEDTVTESYGIVINGHSLAHALEEHLELELLRTACMCKSVICCRVTPLQKAQVVAVVKKYKKAVTLAIGDGANDVSMIKEAHIGVGISGQEGMQAVLSSDFSFAQFRYLQRLLLVHGRWSYIRMCKFLSYFFYKNFTFTLVHFWYAFFSGYSAQTVYDEWFITLYNLVYTSLPVLGMSLFEQDVDDRWSLEYPQLYEPGQQNLYFNKVAFMKCVFHGIWSSLVLFFLPYGAIQNLVRDDGKDVSDYQSFALVAQTCLLLVVSAEIGVDSTYWTAVNQFFIWGSLAVYFTITFTMYSDGMYLIFTASFPFIGTARNSLTQPSVWLSVFLTTILCVLPVVAYRFFMVMLRPNFSDKLNYMISKSKKRPPPEQRRARLRRVSSRRSSYAFSHQQGFGALIMSGRNMRPRTAPAASSRVIDRSNTAAAAAGSSSRSANATMRNVIVDGS
uniref:Phospholipid-transporting ATPase n=1 Tax=Latimeria chalumnae TaxID=7897 RepID=H3A6P4_LATCH|nr:PREDICTED: phospholipid-transporting ATPase ID-like isoform X1 [Latimeria chalumnae]XP_014350659.1 PREDICTED: phospholipid-transporting ATPase ID-like isoform X1 [Latimeria chalumnae]XP_014350660.1 PREDICTED: phospholipid-transporting ATPase ID-like isoform X1 [Latimeria chalumnae]XP_014350661.1 PREDICTED: phospholipid-transporting ATPase ID-like isoform X1 [Latimeria chalumnae]|eukprot:XP_014350658.1 PREDICTED: phospholipid-transporting ATPase ID-like isoform X1 [Latimeria chalumnae]